MKNTLALSMMICGLVLAGCAKDDTGADSGAATATASATNGTSASSGDGDGDAETGTTGDTTTTTTTTDGSTSLTTMGFVPDEDFAGVSECDPFAQDCPEGEKCVPYGSTGGNWDANKCVTVMGDGVAGDTCTYGGTTEATDDCDADSHCWDVMDDGNGNLVGVCTPFCTGTADDPVCPPSTSCLIANEGSITLCIATCDPLVQDCGEGLACFWANNGFNCIFTTQDIPLGEPCGYINDCVAGLICLDATVLPSCGGSACCGSFCDTADTDNCDSLVPGTECTAFFEMGMAPPGYENVGVCIVPGA
jgi:hypothetical protein